MDEQLLAEAGDAHLSLIPVSYTHLSDAAGNLVARISPPHLPREQARRAAVRLLAHLDEIAMIVKRVEADGTLRVVALGGAQPVSFGVCPVQILAGEAVLDLSLIHI